MNSKHFSGNVVSQERWTRNKGQKSEVQVDKSAVRVAKGTTGGNRPGTFHGATNFRGSERQV